MATSDKRRRLAVKLRDVCDEIEHEGNGLTEFELADVLGIRDDDTGMMESLDLDDVRSLADLIDPTCENLSDVNPVDGFICSACGWPGVVQQAIDNGWQEYEFDEFMEYVPRYCPCCGSRLVRR